MQNEAENIIKKEPRLSSESTLSVLGSRRFLPFFLTQFCGAFNDNLFKNSLILFVTFAGINQIQISVNLFINLAAGLYILPFFIFSASAGVLADHMDKSRLIQLTKVLEIFIMAFGAYGFYSQNYWFLLLLLFLMGTQSAIFGPSKYAILPQHLKGDALISGNAWVELGTFLAILLGTLISGIIVDSQQASIIAGVGVLLMAISGFITSLFIDKAPASQKFSEFSWQPITHTKQTLAILNEDKSLKYAIYAISWFWLLGSTYLTQIPNYTKLYLESNASAVSFLLALFSFGIAAGSLLTSKILKKYPNLPCVSLGSLGLSLAGLGLSYYTPTAISSTKLNTFLLHHEFWPVFAFIFGLGVCGALFILPLYIYMQKRAKPTQRAQVIAANNIYNSLFMVLSAVLGIIIISLLGQEIPHLFAILSLINFITFGLLIFRPIKNFYATIHQVD